ncbi:MAG: TadE family type IV pilus minor pilin [Candidatus Nanopelagicales bacterium]
MKNRQLRHDQSGMVTAELAVALVGLVVVLAMVLFAVAVAVAHIRTQEAARVAARAAARGDSGGDISEAAHRAAPGSSVEVQRNGERVRVVVRDRLRLPMLRIGGVTVTSDSVAGVEPR